MPEVVLVPVLAITFALVWAALGYMLGTRVAERRFIRAALQEKVRSRPLPLDNTVARQFGPGPEHSWKEPEWSGKHADGDEASR